MSINTKLNKIWYGVEPIVVVFLLLTAESLNLPPILQSIFNLASYIGIGLLIIPIFSKMAYVLSQNKALLLLFGLAFISLIWSETQSATFQQIRVLPRTILIATFLSTRYSYREQINLVYWTTAIAGIISLVVFILNPSYALGTSSSGLTLRGIYEHKQVLGRIMALGASVFLLKIYGTHNKRWLAIIFLSLMIGLLLLSASKTGLIMLIVSILVLPLHKIAKQQYMIRIITLFTLILIGATIATLVIINLETILVDVLGKDIEFNGRTEIWQLAIQKALEKPWLGYGYYGFWGSDAGEYIAKNTWGRLMLQTGSEIIFWHAHNGYLEMFLQLGFFGLFLVLLTTGLTLIRLIKLLVHTRQIEFLWMLQLLAIIITWNMSEAMTFLSSNIFGIFHISVILSTTVEYNLKRTEYRSLSTSKNKFYSV